MTRSAVRRAVRCSLSIQVGAGRRMSRRHRRVVCTCCNQPNAIQVGRRRRGSRRCSRPRWRPVPIASWSASAARRTNDGGVAMIESLGEGAEQLRGIDVVVATDVDNPLLGPLGATAVFSAQKGATAEMMPVLEERLARFADLIGPELAQIPGAGAAGGLGFGLYALGGHREGGADLVLRELDVAGLIAASELVVTGEGSLDGQSLGGKLPIRVAASCLDVGVPCIAIAGRVMLGRRQVAVAGFAGAYSIESYAGSLDAAIALGAAGLRGLPRRSP